MQVPSLIPRGGSPAPPAADLRKGWWDILLGPAGLREPMKGDWIVFVPAVFPSPEFLIEVRLRP